MRILHVLKHRDLYNGMVTAAVDLACAQVKLGHDVAVYSLPGDFDELLATSGVSLFDIKSSGNAGFLISFTLGLIRVVRTFKPDVIHAHMISVALLSKSIASLSSIPFVTCVQNSYSKYSYLMKVGDRVITGCKAVADDMERRGIPRKKLRPILNGTIGSARQAFGVSTNFGECYTTIRRPAVITACGLHPRKGVPDLIAGFKEANRTIPELSLYIFGGGPCEAEYKALASDGGPTNIIFCGQVPYLKPFLELADAFVLASLADPAPLVICEAREAGLAIVATNVDGIPELLADGNAGILVAPKCPWEIAQALVRLFGEEKQLLVWKHRSREFASYLSVDRVAAETVEVYAECVRGIERTA